MKTHKCTAMEDEVSIALDKQKLWTLFGKSGSVLTILFCPYCGKKFKRYDNEQPEMVAHYHGELGLHGDDRR
ncbi:MAG: hypothetical protein KAS32_00585 [Candidatus Peribacteraceae bacterium]|nr:hypothetical protein [Candidatus Peribacteraceae bacterium]